MLSVIHIFKYKTIKKFKYKPIKIFKYLLQPCMFAVDLLSKILKNILISTLLLNSSLYFYMESYAQTVKGTAFLLSNRLFSPKII